MQISYVWLGFRATRPASGAMGGSIAHRLSAGEQAVQIDLLERIADFD